MKKYDINLNPEIKKVILDRKRKLLFAMYILCFFLFALINIKNIYFQNNINTIILGFSALLLIIFSFYYLYKPDKLELASYSILFIVGITIIFGIIFNKYDNFMLSYILTFFLTAYFLFSWEKGLIINASFLCLFFLISFLCKSYLEDSSFLNNPLAISNFIIVAIVVFVFTYFYEVVRVDAYKMILESNYKKDLLYQELHHRVKNNLNIITSMLSMQAQREDKNIKDILQVSKNRIESIGMVHSMLYITDNLEKVNAKHFIQKLTENIKNTVTYKIDTVLIIDELELNLNEIIPIGLILNELLTNSFKHAFKNVDNPKIIIVFKKHKNLINMIYYDNGRALANNKQNLGLKLVELNVKQLKGSLRVKNNNGLIYKITYKRR